METAVPLFPVVLSSIRLTSLHPMQQKNGLYRIREIEQPKGLYVV